MSANIQQYAVAQVKDAACLAGCTARLETQIKNNDSNDKILNSMTVPKSNGNDVTFPCMMIQVYTGQALSLQSMRPRCRHCRFACSFIYLVTELPSTQRCKQNASASIW